MARRLEEALKDSTAQFRVTQICNVLQKAVTDGDQQNRMAMLKKLVEVDLNDAEVDQPLLIFEILLQTLAMPKAADLDVGSRSEIASNASRFLTIFFVRCGDRVTISKEVKDSAAARLGQLLAVSDANAKVQPEGAFQFHIKRMQQTLHCIQDTTASPYPGVALTLIQAAATLSLSNLADAAIEALKVIAADLVDRAIQMLEGRLLSRLAALDFIRVAPNLARLAEVLEERGDDVAEIEVPEFDVDEFIETLVATLPAAAKFDWMHSFALMDSLMALAKLGMSVKNMTLALFGSREPHFDASKNAGIAAYCAHGDGLFDRLNPLSNNWRIRDKAVNCLVSAHKQTKNKGLKAAIATILADRRMLEKDERVSLTLNRPDLATEFNELLKKDWQERSDVYLSAIGDLNAKISEMMGRAEGTTNDAERAETQQQIAEAREYLQVLMERMTSVSKTLGKLDTINDKLTEFRDEHQKQWQKFEQRFGAEMARLEERREADQKAVMNKLDAIHQLMAAMQAGGGSSAEPVLQLEEIVAKLKAQYLNQELDMVMTKDRIPLEKIFIQLAVVESNIGGKLSEDTKRHAVPLAQMFRERKRRLVKKVLIVGKAGVGKTTLCKKFTYDWATGALWPQFRFVFVLKFRNVNRNRYANPDEQHLAHALVREQLSDRGVEHTSALMTAVRDILKNHLEETLIVCDGYDESTDTPPTIIDDLFRCPNVIFTSRPYGIEQIVNRFDLHIENIGFTAVHIKEYIRMFFDALQGGDDGALAARALITFLDTNPNILVTSTVPVNLQLVCSLFLRQRDVFASGHVSIGSLYHKLVEYLLEGYFERESITNPAPLDHAVRRTCGKIAFEGLNNSHVVLPNRLLAAAVSEEPLFENNILNLFRVGLIKPAIEGKHVPLWKQDGFFLHLTFQEFFAATWLATHMSASERTEWIRANKFTPRLALTVCFTMSILMIEGRTNDIVDAFGAIMQAPVDEARLVQSLLVLRAFDELSVPVIRKVEAATKAVSLAMQLMRDVIQRGESDAVAHVAAFMESTSLITSAPEIAGSLDGVLGDPKSSDAASRVLLAMGKYYPTHPVTLRANVASLGLLQECSSPKQMHNIVSAAVSSGRMERFVQLMRHHREDKAVYEFVLQSAAKSQLLLLGLVKPMLVGASLHRDMRATTLLRGVLAKNVRTVTEEHCLYDEDHDESMIRWEYRATGVTEGADPFAHRRRNWAAPPISIVEHNLMRRIISSEVLDAFGRELHPPMQRGLLAVVGPVAALCEIEAAWDAAGEAHLDEALIRVHFENHFDDGDGTFVATCIASRIHHFTASEALRQYWSCFVCRDALCSSFDAVATACGAPLAQWLTSQVLTKMDRIISVSRAAPSCIEELTRAFTVPRNECSDAAHINLHELSHHLRVALLAAHGAVEAMQRLDKLACAAPTPNHALALKYQIWIVWTAECGDRDVLPGLTATVNELDDHFRCRNMATERLRDLGDPHDALSPSLRMQRASADHWTVLTELLALPHPNRRQQNTLFVAYVRLMRRFDARVVTVGEGAVDDVQRAVLAKLSAHPKVAKVKHAVSKWSAHCSARNRPPHMSAYDSRQSDPSKSKVLRRHWSHQLDRLPIASLLQSASARALLLPRLLDMTPHKELTNTVMEIIFHDTLTPPEARTVLLRIADLIPRLGGFVGLGGSNYLHRVAFSLHHRFANVGSVTEVLTAAQSSTSLALRAFALEIAPPLAWDAEGGPAAAEHYAAAVATSLDQPILTMQAELLAAITAADSLLQTAVATAADRLCGASTGVEELLVRDAPVVALHVVPVCWRLWKADPEAHRNAVQQLRDLQKQVALGDALTSPTLPTLTQPSMAMPSHVVDETAEAMDEDEPHVDRTLNLSKFRVARIALYSSEAIRSKWPEPTHRFPELHLLGPVELFEVMLATIAEDDTELKSMTSDSYIFQSADENYRLPEACLPVWIDALMNLEHACHKGGSLFAATLRDRKAPVLRELLTAAALGDRLPALVTKMPELLDVLTAFGTATSVQPVVAAALATSQWDLLLLLSPRSFLRTPLTAAPPKQLLNGAKDTVTITDDGLVCLDEASGIVGSWQERGIKGSLFLALMPVGCNSHVVHAAEQSDEYTFPFVVRVMASMVHEDGTAEAREHLVANLSRHSMLAGAVSNSATKRHGDSSGFAFAEDNLLFNASSDWSDVGRSMWSALYAEGVPPPLSLETGNPELFALLAGPFSLASIIPRYAVIARQCASNFLHIAHNFAESVEAMKEHLHNGVVFDGNGSSETSPLQPNMFPGDDHYYAVVLVEVFCKAYGMLLCDKCITTVKTRGNSIEIGLASRFAAADVLPVMFSKTCSSCTGQLSQILSAIAGTPQEPQSTVMERFFESWSASEPSTMNRFASVHVEKIKFVLQQDGTHPQLSKLVNELHVIADRLGDQSSWKLWYNSMLTTSSGNAPPSSEVNFKDTFFWLFQWQTGDAGRKLMTQLASDKDPRLDHLLHYCILVRRANDMSAFIEHASQHSATVAQHLVERMIVVDSNMAFESVEEFVGRDQDEGEGEAEEAHNMRYMLVDRPEFTDEDILLPTFDDVPYEVPPDVQQKMKALDVTQSWNNVMAKAEAIASFSGFANGVSEIMRLATPQRDVVALLEIVASVLMKRPVTGWTTVRRAFQDSNKLREQITDPNLILSSLATPGVPSAFVRLNKDANSYNKVCTLLCEWCVLLQTYCTKAAPLLDVRRRAFDAACVEPLRQRKVKVDLYHVIDVPPSWRNVISDPVQAQAIAAANALAERLSADVARFFTKSIRDKWKGFVAGHAQPPLSLMRIVSVFASVFCGRRMKLWRSLRVWLLGSLTEEHFHQHSIGKFYSEAMMLQLAKDLNSEEWRADVEASHTDRFPSVIDSILRSVLAYWEAAAPLLELHLQAVEARRQERKAERASRRSARVATLMFAMWVWHVAEEDFKQSQVREFPIRVVLDAVASAQHTGDAHLASWLMVAAATICRAQQRALMVNPSDTSRFTFTEDNAVVDYSATLSDAPLVMNHVSTQDE